MTNLDKFILSILKEPVDKLGVPITHEIAVKRKISNAKLRNLTNILHKLGMSKDMYLRIKKCNTCKEQTGWKIAYHLEVAYRNRLHNLFNKTFWNRYKITKINRLTDEKIEYNIGIANLKKIVKCYDIIDANVTSEPNRYCFVFANDNYKYIIDGSVKSV